MKGGDEDSEEAADGEAEISIVGRRRKGSVVQYLLRWDSGAQTWESAADGAKPLMAEYDEQNPQPTPGKKRGAPWSKGGHSETANLSKTSTALQSKTSTALQTPSHSEQIHSALTPCTDNAPQTATAAIPQITTPVPEEKAMLQAMLHTTVLTK